VGAWEWHWGEGGGEEECGGGEGEECEEGWLMNGEGIEAGYWEFTGDLDDWRFIAFCEFEHAWKYPQALWISGNALLESRSLAFITLIALGKRGLFRYKWLQIADGSSA